jgi:heme/copper-type cytochrome/quinol oxidase subunit 2
VVCEVEEKMATIIPYEHGLTQYVNETVGECFKSMISLDPNMSLPQCSNAMARNVNIIVIIIFIIIFIGIVYFAYKYDKKEKVKQNGNDQTKG